jgi:Glycosyl hydrolase family 71
MNLNLTPIFAIALSLCGLATLALGQQPAAPLPNAPTTRPAPKTYKVFAHYMPCYPPLRSPGTPGDSYGYQPEFDPASDSSKAGKRTKPLVVAIGSTDEERRLNAFIAEIRLAKSAGIDGFLVDLLEDQDNYRQVWLSLLKAAEIVGDFEIGLMPDYATLGGPSATPRPNPDRPNDPVMAEKVKYWLDVAKDSPALLRFNGKPVVASYGVGHPDAVGAAKNDKEHLVDYLASRGVDVAYMATHGLDWPLWDHPHAKEFAAFSFGTGSFTPTAGTALRDRALKYWSDQPDTFLIMGEVCPLYYNNGWLYGAPRLSELYRQQWEWNIRHRDRVSWIQVLTWNDFAESSITPDHNHNGAWLAVTRFYADWFKTGIQPTIESDWVAIFHRPHPYDAKPSPYTRKLLSNRPTDEVEALAFLWAPATVVIKSGDVEHRKDVSAGVQSLIVPFSLGVQSARVERDGKVVARVESAVPIHDNPVRENLLFIAATSLEPQRVLAKPQGELTGTQLFGDAAQLFDADIRATLTPGPTPAAVVARSFNGSSYKLTLVQINGESNWSLLLDHADKARSKTIATGKLPATTGASEIDLRLVASGENLVVYANGRLLGVHHDFALPLGQFGVSGDATHAIKNVQLLAVGPNLEMKPTEASPATPDR